MKGTRILVTSKPRGVFEDVYVVGTPKPGTIMEIEPAVEPVGGLFHYAVYGTQAHATGHYVENDGDRKCIAVLVEKDQEGDTYDDAYVDDDLGRVYFPAPGEQLNILAEDVGGTGDTKAIGEEFMVDDGTGKLLTADNNAQQHPFTGLETITDGTVLGSDHVVWCRFNGGGGG